MAVASANRGDQHLCVTATISPSIPESHLMPMHCWYLVECVRNRNTRSNYSSLLSCSFLDAPNIGVRIVG
jgi:hypothetical protein